MRALVAVALAFATALIHILTAAQPQRATFAGVLDEHPAIRYADAPTTDAMGAVALAAYRGAASLKHEVAGGYLKSLLAALDISPESQLLVFSRTGLQRAHTGPLNPRALYFNDTVVVGYIPGARHIEIAAHDPQQGVVFYTLDQTITTAPEIARRTNCLTCHVSGSTLDVPGAITRSNFTNANGELLPQLGFHIVDHRTPLPQRWGGWFVTGKYDLAPYGGVTHMGNVSTALHPVHQALAGTSNEILHAWLKVDAPALGYASHDSDIAALMVFDHQMRAMNLLTRLNWEARVAAHDGAVDFARGELRNLADELADYLLFDREVPPPARLAPRAGFANQFVARGPRDSRGRSLRELDLTSRLLKYGVSHMIYSPAFEGLPAAARHAVYRRMREVLGSAGDARTPAERQAITEILRETKADWPSSH